VQPVVERHPIATSEEMLQVEPSSYIKRAEMKQNMRIELDVQLQAQQHLRPCFGLKLGATARTTSFACHVINKPHVLLFDDSSNAQFTWTADVTQSRLCGKGKKKYGTPIDSVAV